ncbi:SRPBCC family protein [Kitasatospora viridis]|uniref:Polyketide cyclase/dehydrase/lipid transport protein n=1 Tax=Kitasatospora viridis TaxID=281105 RepID=A0A561ULS0_9ACTN|nr:SRPBCC family protein [Kitasatospora viridis]TWG00312.1 polyketide cyclase/dehydrase/lipid transport protein [Kitasatospora viridis]
MRHRVEVEMAAAPEAVWAVLTDVQSWHRWTPSIELIRRQEPQEPFGLGSRALVKQPRMRRAVWEVSAFEAGRSFDWRTGSPGARTEAGHELRPVPGGTRVILDLAVTGPLAPLGTLLYGRLIRQYLGQEAAGLKRWCETTATGP